MVAHCGTSVAGSHVHSLVLTDIASGWTEAAALIVREQTLITVTLDEIQSRLPFPMLGLDVDNDSAFINETLLSYCRKRDFRADTITGRFVRDHRGSSEGENHLLTGRRPGPQDFPLSCHPNMQTIECRRGESLAPLGMAS